MTPPSTVHATPRPAHAEAAPTRARAYGVVSAPMLDDLLAAANATALDLAANQLKHLARAGGISASRASRWATEGTGNPLYDCTLVLYKLAAMDQHPGALVAHMLTTLQHALMRDSDADLCRRFWTLIERECETEGGENKASAMFAHTGDLAALESAIQREQAVQIELAAVIREMRWRDIDPRLYRGH